MRKLYPVLKVAAAFLFLINTVFPAGAESPLPALGPVVQASGQLLYAAGEKAGIYASVDGGKSWDNRSDGLPNKIVYPFTGDESRRITSFSYDPVSPERIAVTTATKAFVSSNGGEEWVEIPLSHPIRMADYLTSIALSPHSAETFFIGTSFNGYYVTTNGGKNWSSGSSSIGGLYRGAAFYEEVKAIAVSPADSRHVFLAAGFGAGVYESWDGARTFQRLAIPDGVRAESVEFMTFFEERETEWTLGVQDTDGTTWGYGADEVWSEISEAPPSGTTGTEDDRSAALRRRIAGERTGIYVNASWAEGDDLSGHLELLREHGMDTIVVDMKDDAGRLSYDTELKLPVELGAVRQRFTLGELLTSAHRAGVYVVGRIVVFQDPKLYRYESSAHAIWDRGQNAAWGNLIRVPGKEGEADKYEQREFWVDPYSEFVWEYNVAIAEELQKRGVDEIQFDYIRFPSDGDLSRVQYRHRRPGMTRADAIESFLRFARTKISIPISTDLYGFNSWYRMGNWIGQNIDIIADYVDVVCPMFYPSHFPSSFMGDLDFFDRARFIYEVGGTRAAEITDGRSVVRPYVQAFLIGSERRFEEPAFTTYLARQLEGVNSSDASGFTLWNASNIYYMVVESLTRFTRKDNR